MFKKLFLIVLVTNICNISAMDINNNENQNSINDIQQVYNEEQFQKNVLDVVLKKYGNTKFITSTINKELYDKYNNIQYNPDPDKQWFLSGLPNLTCYEGLITILLHRLLSKSINIYRIDINDHYPRKIISFTDINVSDNLKRALALVFDSVEDKYDFCTSGNNYTLAVTYNKNIDFAFGPIMKQINTYESTIQELFYVNSLSTAHNKFMCLLDSKKFKFINDTLLDSNNCVTTLIDRIVKSTLGTNKEKLSLLQLLKEFYNKQMLIILNCTKPISTIETFDINMHLRNKKEILYNQDYKTLKDQLYKAYEQVISNISEQINNLKNLDSFEIME